MFKIKFFNKNGFSKKRNIKDVLLDTYPLNNEDKWIETFEQNLRQKGNITFNHNTNTDMVWNNNSFIFPKKYNQGIDYLESCNMWSIQISWTIYRIGSKTPILHINNIFMPWVNVVFWDNWSWKTTLIKNMAWILENDSLKIKTYKSIQMYTDKIYANLWLSMGQEKIIKHKYMIENSQHLLIDEPFANIDQKNQMWLIKYLILFNRKLIDDKSRCIILFINDKKILNIISKVFITYIIKEKKLFVLK